MMKENQTRRHKRDETKTTFFFKTQNPKPKKKQEKGNRIIVAGDTISAVPAPEFAADRLSSNF